MEASAFLCIENNGNRELNVITRQFACSVYGEGSNSIFPAHSARYAVIIIYIF